MNYKNSGLTKSPDVRILTKEETKYLLDTYHYLGFTRTYKMSIGHDEGCTVWGVLRSRILHSQLKFKGFEPCELIRMVGIEHHK